MAVEPSDWQKITPEQLRAAVTHIRSSFDTAVWKCSEVTKAWGYAALHPGWPEPPSLAPAFLLYRSIVGPVARQKFDELCRVRTPPALFKAHLDFFYRGIEVQVPNEFDQLLQIGIANFEALEGHPVEWAKSHMHLLINGNAYRVKMWIKEVCDQQGRLSETANKEDVEEWLRWKTWRAPKLIHMKPSGNTPYDTATAWTREDEPRTLKLLNALSGRFVEFLGFGLDKIAGAAHVSLAISKEHFQVHQQKLNRAQPTCYVSKAPEPIKPLGSSCMPPRPKATRLPLDLPLFYPNPLKPRTTVVMAAAVRKFPLQTETLNACKYFISELAPLFRAAVQSKTIRPEEALSNICNLISSFLICNYDDPSDKLRLEQEVRKSEEWLKFATEIAIESESRGVAGPGSPDTQLQISSQSSVATATTWDLIEISFLSDERVQIHNGTRNETRNYAELGFADRRSGKPSLAWLTLRALAELHGIIRNSVEAGCAWSGVEKRIQEIRRVFRKHFGITADPIPFVTGTGYQARFKLGCNRSFHT